MPFYDTLSSEAQQCLENKPMAISYWLNVNTHEKYLNYKMNLWESEESIVVDCLVPTCGSRCVNQEIIKITFFMLIVKDRTAQI